MFRLKLNMFRLKLSMFRLNMFRLKLNMFRLNMFRLNMFRLNMFKLYILFIFLPERVGRFICITNLSKFSQSRGVRINERQQLISTNSFSVSCFDFCILPC